MYLRTLISSLSMLLLSSAAHAARAQVPDLPAKVAYLDRMVSTLGATVAALAVAICVLSVFLFIGFRKLHNMRKELEEMRSPELKVDDLMPPRSEEAEKDAKADRHMALAEQAAGQRRFEDALREYDLSLKVNEFQHEAWNLKAVALSELGRHEEAVEACENSLFIKPGIPHVWKNKGNALSELGRFEEAIEAYEYMLKLYPEDFQCWYSKGVALAKLGRTEDALAAYYKAIEARPDLHEAYYNCACSHAIMGNRDAALGDLEKAIGLEAGYKETARQDKDLKSLLEDEDFKRVTGVTDPV